MSHQSHRHKLCVVQHHASDYGPTGDALTCLKRSTDANGGSHRVSCALPGKLLCSSAAYRWRARLLSVGYLEPGFRVTALQLSVVVNDYATILLFALIDPEYATSHTPPSPGEWDGKIIKL